MFLCIFRSITELVHYLKAKTKANKFTRIIGKVLLTEKNAICRTNFSPEKQQIHVNILYINNL